MSVNIPIHPIRKHIQYGHQATLIQFYTDGTNAVGTR